MRLLTRDDLIDLYCRLKQRGWGFISSKFTTDPVARTKSAFDESSVQASHWWKIPKVRQRWNEKICGVPDVEYEEYLVNEYLHNRIELKLLSLGSGSCSHELKLAAYPQFLQISCVDLAENRLEKAKRKAEQMNFSNMEFISGDVHEMDWEEESFDIILFHSALHHMYNVETLLKDRVRHFLKPGGLLVINEYVGPNRLQYPAEQIQAINQALDLIPIDYKQRFKTSLSKNKYNGSGWLRMLVADPSECVDSAAILPAIHRHFEVVEEKPYGGNILMPVLKDIAHHFYELDARKLTVLQQLFEFEDEYLKEHSSDFLLGIYRKN